jgi:surface antigen
MRTSLRPLVLALALGMVVAAPARADWLDQMRNAGPGEIGVNKTTGGALLGAALGGLLGSQIGKGDGRLVGTAVGVLGGAFLGATLGRQLDEADRAYERKAGARALTAPIGRQVAWRNPDSGHSGSVRPVRSWRNDAGQPCRELEREVLIDRQRESATVTVCRGSDGAWEIQP